MPPSYKYYYMIAIIPENEARKDDYRVQRPFIYQEVEYARGEAVEATDDDLKFLLKNNLIK